MKGGPLVFAVVPHKDGALSHHLELGTFPTNFWLPYVPGPLLRVDKELGCPTEVVKIFEIEVTNFAWVVFQVQDNGAYALGFYDPPIPFTYASYPGSIRFKLCVELEVGVNGVSAPWIP